MKKFRFTKRPAESLIEVIIAIFVVSLGAGTASTLIVNALQSNSFSRDNLIALNLAVEGIEAMRDIRDTNWLKFSFDRKNCWDLMPGTATCDVNSKIKNDNYTVYLNVDYDWQLTPFGTTSPLNLDNFNGDAVNNYYKLRILTSGGLSEKKIYSSNETIEENPSTFTQLAQTDPFYGRFYRMIQISNPDLNSMSVTSVVQWKSQNVVHSITLSTLLTNYQM